ncbi:hypothetical protein [Ichthyobacterium seriolicida]|uniref:Lipoprotein n=1 Tax=Ichthyobacterium seriolicida TaxID=242600 RepID=A0A1J1E2D2_9FLAO|nr:hypothetical protein [Ichthyobacterium seriolicida]BAV94196.1 hypothetical protein JBKA6_0183 [Ichthyobacterium seriolicida]
MKKTFNNSLLVLITGLIIFSCRNDNVTADEEGEIYASKLVEIKSVIFSRKNNKISNGNELTELYRGLFVKKTPGKISQYTDEEEATLNSKISIVKNDIYVKVPYNQTLNIDKLGTLNATISFVKAPDNVILTEHPVSKISETVNSMSVEFPVTIKRYEFSHSNMLVGITKYIKFSKKVGSRNSKKIYKIHFKYDDNETKLSNCDLFPIDTKKDAKISNFSFTTDYKHNGPKVNNSYVCENIHSGSKSECSNLSKSIIVTPVLTKDITVNSGDSETNPIEMHFDGGVLSGSATIFNDTSKAFDVGHLNGDKMETGKTLPNFSFIADGSILPDGAFFSIEDLKGTNCNESFKQRICPRDPSKIFKVENQMPQADNGIVFKVVAQDGITQKFYKLIFKNKYDVYYLMEINKSTKKS